MAPSSLAEEHVDRPIRVLVVDDHRMFRDFLSSFLSNAEDIDVVAVVGTGSDGVDAARELAPDVVLMDYVLPDMSGTTAISLIKHERPETKLVLLTGTDNDEVLAEAIEVGCSGFVAKDSSPELALRAVRAAAAGEMLLPDRLTSVVPRLRSTTTGIPYDMSPREFEVLVLMAQGLANRMIAEALFISVNTVRNHVQRVISKLGAHSKLEAVSTAVREHIVEIAHSP